MECGMHGETTISDRAVPRFLTLSQVWSTFENESLFTVQDPELQTYRSRAHVAEMISLLGPPPRDLLVQGKLSDKFFTDKGEQRSFNFIETAFLLTLFDC